MLAPGPYARRLVVSVWPFPGDPPCRRPSLICPTCCRCCRGENTATPVRARVSWSWRPTLPVSDGAIIRRARIRCWHRWRVWSTTTPPTRGAHHLAELIPAVIGLTGDDLHIDALISLRCARIALPVAAADRQRVLAVSVLVCERVLARLDGRAGNSLSPDSERVLEAVPEAAQWASRFASQDSPRLTAFGPTVRTGRCPLRGRGRRTRADPRS